MLLPPASLLAQGTAFTYQGRLDDAGNPANGNYDLRFALYDGVAGGSLIAGPLTNTATAVSNGLFTITLDFGAGVFTGPPGWLEIGVRTNGGAEFTTLTPRQRLTATPYAILAGNVSGVLANSSLPANPTFNGTVEAYAFRGSGAGLTNLSASQLTSGILPDASLPTNVVRANQVWLLEGNAGTTPGVNFLGTTDNQPFELFVNNIRALRIEPTTNYDDRSNLVNVVAGSPVNTVGAAVYGATISGGGAANWFGLNIANFVNADFGTISGGGRNTIQTNSHSSVIGGGFGHTIENYSDHTTISGGYANIIQTNSGSATIGGGGYNTIYPNAAYATIPGGILNAATNFAFAAGNRAKANHTGAFVWADSTSADFASTAPNQFNIRAAGGVRIESSPGIALNAANSPLITRGWDLFGATAPSEKQRHGRWGLFMEPSRLTIGIPSNDIPNRFFQVAKYSTDGSATALMTVDQNGNVTATTFTGSSDRHAKENFEPVNPLAVLEKVAAMPLTTWNYKSQDPSIRHIGPTAQDFKAAFGLGENDTGIATVDADGVALAAIQGLNTKIENGRQKMENRLQALEAENASLKARLEKLEQLLAKKLQGGTQ